MNKIKRFLQVTAVIVLVVAGLVGWQVYREIRKAASEDPAVWAEDISALEKKTAGLYPPGEGIVFIGSSSIRFWSTLAEDMAPLPVIKHGFGGAKLNDVVVYAQRLVNAYRPRAVVVFAGTNDIDPNASKEPEVLVESYRKFVAAVRADQPEVPILYIGITPSPLRWSVWDIAVETNRLIGRYSLSDPNLHFIDTSPGLLGKNGEPIREHYIFDGLHLSESGYAAWTSIIRPRLEAVLAEY